MRDVGVVMVFFGGVLVVVGLVFVVGHKLPFGQLPGDIHIQGRRADFFFPLTTCLLLSVILTFVLGVVLRFFRR